MDRQAEALGLELNYFTAVDGRTQKHPLFENVNHAKRRALKGRPFKAGELGVWASHYLLWQECVKANRVIIVLEDDAVLNSNFPGFLGEAESLAQRFSYFRLIESDFPSKKIAQLDGFSIHRYWKSPLRTTAYVLAPEAAQKFLAKAQDWVLPVDDYMDLSWLHGVDCLGLKPGCISDKTEFQSTVQEDGVKERLTLPQKLRRESFRYYLRLRYCTDFVSRGLRTLNK